MTCLIVTLVGPDRPGLVSGLAAQVADAGGSWLESRLARLAGQFAGVVRVEMPAAAVGALQAALAGLEGEGFRAVLQEAAPEAAAAGPATATLELVGQDRPGIVRDMARVLAEHRVNIEELTTRVENGSFSGEAMFRAEALLRIPPPLSVDDVRAALESLGNEMMVDVKAAAP